MKHIDKHYITAETIAETNRIGFERMRKLREERDNRRKVISYAELLKSGAVIRFYTGERPADLKA